MEASWAMRAGYVIVINSRATSPDTVNNTQYRRTIRAVNESLGMHPSIDRQRLGGCLDGGS